MQRLTNKRILLGISGGIAAYKSAELTRLLKKAGADVRVVMTAAATEFITPLTLQALSGHPVHLHLLDPEAEAGMGHIELARWADLLLIAPASADCLARLAAGMGNDLLTTLCLATQAPVCVAPAMNQAMWRDTITQQNMAALHTAKMHIWGPDQGEQACGDVGPGRMLEPAALLQAVEACFQTGSLAGQHLLITAGPTREALDPVRYLSNHSSGKMGYALAQAAVEAGAQVTLISGPVALPCPDRVKRVSVESAQEMLDATLEVVLDPAAPCDIFIAAAAVADYRAAEVAEQKIKKTQDERLVLTLIKNPDILAQVAALPQRPFCVGFAAETQQVEAHALAKLQSKRLDMIIANDVSDPTIGFNAEENSVLVISHQTKIQLPRASKSHLARQLIELIAQAVNTQKS